MDDKFQKIIDKIKNVTHDLYEKGESSNAVWTEVIKKGLLELGKENGYCVYTSGVTEIGAEKDWGEWLWDLVWAKQKRTSVNSEIQMVTNLPLIAEIEWNTNWEEIILDFQKLVFGLADYKLYIFTKTGNENEIFNLCTELSQVDTVKNGNYLLIGIPSINDKRDFFTKSF